MPRFMPIRHDPVLARSLTQLARLRFASVPPPYAWIWERHANAPGRPLKPRVHGRAGRHGPAYNAHDGPNHPRRAPMKQDPGNLLSPWVLVAQEDGDSQAPPQPRPSTTLATAPRCGPPRRPQDRCTEHTGRAKRPRVLPRASRHPPTTHWHSPQEPFPAASGPTSGPCNPRKPTRPPTQ